MAVHNRNPSQVRRSSTAIMARSTLPGRLTQRAKDSGLLPSMGTSGDAYDNAVIESVWARMQTELLDRRRWSTRVGVGQRDL
jgi:putative transposase